MDEATLHALFAPGQTRVAPVQGRSVPLLQAARAGGRGGGADAALGGSLAALCEPLAPQDQRYAAVPVGEFGAAMLRGMGAVVDPAPAAEEEEGRGGGGGGGGGGGARRLQGGRARLGVGATANPLAPPPLPGGARGAAAAAALAHEQAAATAAAAAAARLKRDADPASRALPGAPHVFPTAIIRHAPTAALAAVLQVDNVPGLDKIRAQRLGEGSRLVVEVYSVGDCVPFFESGAGEEERALAAALRRAGRAAAEAEEGARQGAAAAAVAAKAAAAAAAAPAPAAPRHPHLGGREYCVGAVLKIVLGRYAGQKVAVVAASASSGAAGGLMVRPLDGSAQQAVSVAVAEVETVIPKLGGGGACVILKGRHVGQRGVVKEIHTARFCVDVQLESGEVARGVEYEDVTKLLKEAPG